MISRGIEISIAGGGGEMVHAYLCVGFFFLFFSFFFFLFFYFLFLFLFSFFISCIHC